MNKPVLPATFSEAVEKLDAPKRSQAPLVALALPVKDDMPSDTAMCLCGVCTYSMGAARIILWKSDKSPVATARNELAKRAIECGSEFVLWIDADMTFPPDALVRLMKHDVDIVGAMYNRRIEPYKTVGLFTQEPDFVRRGLQEAQYLGFGMVLMKTAVFHKIANPWFEHRIGVPEFIHPDNPFGEEGEDVGFCRKAREAGFKVWCDVDLTFDQRMGHIGSHAIRIKPPEPMSV